jgi:hypothetical protein
MNLYSCTGMNLYSCMVMIFFFLDRSIVLLAAGWLTVTEWISAAYINCLHFPDGGVILLANLRPALPQQGFASFDAIPVRSEQLLDRYSSFRPDNPLLGRINRTLLRPLPQVLFRKMACMATAAIQQFLALPRPSTNKEG